MAKTGTTTTTKPQSRHDAENDFICYSTLATLELAATILFDALSGAIEPATGGGQPNVWNNTGEAG